MIFESRKKVGHQLTAAARAIFGRGEAECDGLMKIVSGAGADLILGRVLPGADSTGLVNLVTPAARPRANCECSKAARI
ncbi:hypothetical protein [Amycolatopsis sp. DSM 110486]|uniref:hypothetical protein n=1 Tax=Amycolatopsis sp. DSM 110486 TaxID=2865832 RepID=UPI001C6A610D|nr:hypothetical protein [Amycolatopsis sp. DSM 110486]QYN19250.1 hypothetical protein K1T34_42550 [Amycolatopsis sp. DSM 110486]